jgi:hypothetical protein
MKSHNKNYKIEKAVFCSKKEEKDVQKKKVEKSGGEEGKALP